MHLDARPVIRRTFLAGFGPTSARSSLPCLPCMPTFVPGIGMTPLPCSAFKALWMNKPPGLHAAAWTVEGRLSKRLALAWIRADPPAHPPPAAIAARCASGALPTVWLHVRIALIPKPDAGTRPIAIAVAAYRVCASATVTALRPWSASWADPALYGGLPGRSAADLHDRLFGDNIHVARAAFASHFFGAKADARRCFDQLDFEVTFRVFAHLGCPPAWACVPAPPLLRHAAALVQCCRGGSPHASVA